MNRQPINKSDAIAAYGGNSAALARDLDITPSAIYQWPEGPIGEVHALKLRFVLKPEIFNQPNPTIPTPSAQPAANACSEVAGFD